MLPERLSNDVCSLKPHVERAAVTVEMEVAPTARRGAHGLQEPHRERCRLTYEGVDAFLRDEGEVGRPG